MARATFGWDDRGLLLSATGTAGTTSYTYNGAGQEASVTNAAGTTGYAYDNPGRLSADTDPAAGVTGSYSYNGLDQVTQISYGTGNDTQSFGYDALHRLTSDSITTASGATVASLGYGYDANNNITSMTTIGLAVAGGGTGTLTNTYGYDQANRLTSWTATPAGGTATTKTYGYDNNGNLISDNGVAQTYDARNELLSDASGNTYAYSAAGNLTQETGSGGTVSGFSTDAYGQQIADASSSYVWDALNRVVSVGSAGSGGSAALAYEGQTRDVTSDSSATYSRDPDGQITGVNATSGKTVALVDLHDDLSGTLAPAGTTMTTSATWDPWGQQLASSGPALQVGYQGQWTDPATGHVNMGSRMYQPSTSGFVNQDTYTGGEGGPAITDNLHAYADDNPVTFTDPSGHMIPVGDGGGTPTVTPADLSADRARIAAANKAAARLSSEAAKANQAAARFEKAAQSFAALARKLNSQAAQMEAAASRAAAAAASAYQGAQAALRAAQAAEARANAEQAAADRDQSLVTVYTVMNPQPQTAAAFQRQANAENAAAAADRYAAAMLYFAYDGLMSLYNYELGLEFQLRFAAAIDRLAAAIAGAFAVVDAAAAAALRASARSLAAAAAAAKREAAAATAKYNADLRAYQAQKQRAAKRKPNLAAFRHTLHCLFDPGALYSRGCAQVYKQYLATQKQIAKCDKNGASAKDCEQIWKTEEEVAAETTHCTDPDAGGQQVCTTDSPDYMEGSGGILFDILRIVFIGGLEYFCDALSEGVCILANIGDVVNNGIDIGKNG